MSGENKERIRPLRIVVLFLAALVLSSLMLVAGVKCRGGLLNGTPLYYGATALLLLSFIINRLGLKLLSYHVGNKTVRDSNDSIASRMERIRTNPAREWLKLRCACILVLVYIALLFVFALSIPFFYGASALSGISMFGMLISVYFLMAFLGKIPFRRKADFSGALPEKDFPLLHKVVREVAEGLGLHKQIHIYIYSNPQDSISGASITVVDERNIVIVFGPVLLSVLDEEELRQVLLHEFGHLDGDSLTQKRLFTFVMDYLLSNSGIFFDFLTESAFVLPCVLLYNYGDAYFRLTSHQAEEEADAYAKKLGNPERMASALAKTNCHTFFEYETEITDVFYAPETLTDSWHTEHIASFRKAFADRESFWRQLLEQELPSRNASHPTFRQRWEAMDFCQYSLVPSPENTAFALECKKAVAIADREVFENVQPYYEKDRKTHYLEPLEIIAAYQSEEKEYTPDALRPVIHAFWKTGQVEKAEALCDRILADYDSPYATAYASYIKGLILFHRYDKAGLAYVWQAIEHNDNYVRDGLEEIALFALQMGLQEELDHYRERYPELIQKLRDQESPGISDKAKLSACTLPLGWQEQILSFIQEAANGHIDKVYLVTEHISEEYQPSSFILRFREISPDEETQQLYNSIYEKVFCLLDDWPDQWEFSLYYYEPSMERALKRVSGCCIYDSTQVGQP